jgi:hypothetical protein
MTLRKRLILELSQATLRSCLPRCYGAHGARTRQQSLDKAAVIQTSSTRYFGGVFQFRQPTLHNQLQKKWGLTLHPMPDKAYLIRFKGTELAADLVIAASVEFQGEHLVFLKSDGTLAALFVLENIESWSEIQR